MAAALSVIIVSYNVRELLRECLQSLRAAGEHLPLQIIVVDNASADGSSEMVGREFPEVERLEMGQNSGFSTANNTALERATAPHLLLLNPDTVVSPDALPLLLEFLSKRPRCGVVGPRLLNTDGSFQPSAWPQPTLISVLRDHLLPPCLRRYAAAAPDRPRSVGWVSGAALLTRRAVIDPIGALDEALFWSEDVDFCRRAASAGWEVWFAPQASIIHHGSRSVPSNRGAVIYHQYRSKLHFFGKHSHPLEWWALRCLLGLEVSAKLGIRGLQRRSPDRDERLRAYRRVLRVLRTGVTIEPRPAAEARELVGTRGKG
jgi:GT2 family glycosyltransferase